MNDDIMNANETRQARAFDALEYYKHGLLEEDGSVCEDDFTDILTDLRHLAGIMAVNFDEVMIRSQMHYAEELSEGN